MRLRVEHLDSALGTHERTPRISWTLPEGASRQVAHEVVLDDGSSSGRVEGDANVLVPWPGAPLRSGERREVRVRVWTDVGEEWSEPAVVESGLLEESDWQARWVSPVEAVVAAPGFRPAHLVRGEVEVPGDVVRARLHVTAHGIHETSLNGVRVGDDELAPGYTEYDHRLAVRVHDVGDLLRPGRNVVGALLADGWYRGQVGMTRAHDQWGSRTAYLAQLVVDHADGTRTVVGTGPGWRWRTSHVLAADLIEGQREDRRLVVPGWDEPGVDLAGWEAVEVLDLGYDRFVGPEAPPVRPVEELRPVSVRRLGAGRDLVDLGQNVNGRVRLTDLGPAGTTLTLTHGEWLASDGDVTTDHLAPVAPFLPEPLGAGQVDVVTSAGADRDVFDPRLTTHGFQYVRVEGHPSGLTADDVTGLVVHTDMERRGWFSCSDPRLERLHDAALWSLRDNVCDIPTDCPQRERAGWTGDWQVFAPTGSFLLDVAGFSVKWLRDLVSTQWDDGRLGNMAPMPPAEKTGFLRTLNGSAGWGDAVVLVPWELYGEYGDLRLLEELWPHMVRWLEFAERSAAEGRHPERSAAHPEPAPHEKYLWDTGFHWGEWLVPGEDPSDFPAFVAADKSDVATAYLAHTAGVTARIAALLGRDDEAARYESLAAGARAAWCAEYLDEQGSVTRENQANLVRALTFHLVPERLRPAIADRLAELVRENGTRLATGFLTTGSLLPALADGGHPDVAHDLLLQDTPPSWLAMVERGATTVWERWEGVDEEGVPHESLNHYSKGAVVSFLHRHVAGLRRVEPTWRRFEVAPVPGGGLTSAAARHLTPHGLAASAWSRGGDGFRLSVTVPPGCGATVRMPSGAVHEAGPGEHEWTEPTG